MRAPSNIAQAPHGMGTIVQVTPRTDTTLALVVGDAWFVGRGLIKLCVGKMRSGLAEKMQYLISNGKVT